MTVAPASPDDAPRGSWSFQRSPLPRAAGVSGPEQLQFPILVVSEPGDRPREFRREVEDVVDPRGWVHARSRARERAAANSAIGPPSARHSVDEEGADVPRWVPITAGG